MRALSSFRSILTLISIILLILFLTIILLIISIIIIIIIIKTIIVLQTSKGEKEYRGSSQKFVDGGKEKRIQWMHNVEVVIIIIIIIIIIVVIIIISRIMIQMDDLEPDKNHFYRVGSNKGW